MLQGPDAAAHAGDEPLARELGQIAAHRNLGNRKCFRKFRNLNGIARLEQAEDVLHPLVLRKRPDRLVAARCARP